jgi:hypothetical protein
MGRSRGGDDGLQEWRIDERKKTVDERKKTHVDCWMGDLMA